MVKTIAREYHWSPTTIGDFFVDKIDHLGLEFWYNDIVEMNKEIRNKN